SVFGARKRTQGLHFAADDVAWEWGDGPTVTGPGEALLMTMLGRSQALGDLGGAGLGTFASRVQGTSGL
ncbi:MAG TPA: hypothetical protein VMZ22_00480, partial [Acidimicrobiales bacterium]|nr:hypothetical protein [Acidimicrobiales bacterium]